MEFGKAVAARRLDVPHLIVTALAGDELIGLARAMFDGVSAYVMDKRPYVAGGG